jgi:hypothetical protein
VSTVSGIDSTSLQLSTIEPQRVKEAVHQLHLQRGGGIIDGDAYDVATDADLIASAEQAFLAYDKEEAAHVQGQAR